MRVSRNQFDQLLERAIDALPEEFARWIDRVPIVVEDAPRSGKDQDILGLYQGTDLPSQMENSGQLPPRIFIYRRPLMEACDSLEQLAEEIRKTLLHELGHYAGMDEEQLEQLGYGPLEEDEIDWDMED